MTIAETEVLLARIEGAVSLTRDRDRCRACGEPTEVHWLSHRD
jgi:ribosomal protein S14